MSKAEAELKQAHDDLDVLGVPRHEHGLPLSVPGRILLLARIAKATQKTENANL